MTPKRWTNRMAEALPRYYATGMGLKQIAAQLGCSKSSVAAHARALGLHHPGAPKRGEPRTARFVLPLSPTEHRRLHAMAQAKGMRASVFIRTTLEL